MTRTLNRDRKDHTCTGCQHFHPFTDARSGYCQRYPPIPVALTYVQNGGNSEVEYHWPIMGKDQFCGEFKTALERVAGKAFYGCKETA